MYARARRGFSLVELLAVLALTIVALTLLLACGVTSCARRSRSAMARSELHVLQAALSMYEADHGRVPAGSARLDDDDAPWLFTALVAPPAPGGGANGPYLDWQPEDVGLLETGVGPPLVRPLQPDELDRLRDPAFLRAHAPDGPSALVLLDPWGRPYHGRSWARLRPADRERLEREPWRRGPFDALPARAEARAPIAHAVDDRPHDDDGWDLWSDGPNGVNEYGAACSDDVTSREPDTAVSCGCQPAWIAAADRHGAGALVLAGALGLAGGLGLARRRRRGPAPRGPRVALRARTRPGRCAFCHDAEAGALLACTACGAGLHLDCWRDAGACPTLGCAT